jgi:hypothetical protein
VTLADLRKLSIRQQFRIRFLLANGLECVIDGDGVARVPALNTPPNFNLEQELASARQFVLEPLLFAGEKHPAKPRSLSREELETLATASPAPGVHDEHDDE